MKRQTVFMAGWGVAAAMAALVAFQSGGKSAGDGGEGPRPDKALIPDAAPDLRRAAQARARVPSSRKEPWQRGAKVPFKNAKWRPHDKWNVPALYETLGDVPPDVRAVADRIFAAHKGASLESALACVDDAAACPDPAVRAMMVDALRLFAMVGTGRRPKSDEDGRASDEARLAAIEAAKRFVDDQNAFVAKNAANTLAAGIWRIRDAEARNAAALDAIKATGGKVLQESFFNHYMSGWDAGLRDREKVREERLLAVAQAIDGLPPGEGRSAAEEAFANETGEPYGGAAGLMEKKAWKESLAEAGTEMFDNSKKKGDEFATVVDVVTRHDNDALEGREEEVEAASKKFATPRLAVRYVMWMDSLRKSAVERYGEGPKADEWFARESAIVEQDMQEWDRKIEENRLKREAEKGAKQ